MFQMSEFLRYLQYISQEELPNGCSPETKWKPTEDFEPWPQRLVYEGTDVIQRYPKSRVVVEDVEVFWVFPAHLLPAFAQGHSLGRQSGTLLLGTI